MGISLKQAVLLAIRNNPDISALSKRYKALQNVPSQQGSLPDPVLSFSALNLPTDSFSLDQEAMTQMQVKLTQAIPFPGKLSLKKEAALKDTQAAGFRLQDARISIAGRAESSWWEIFFLEKALQIIEQNKKYLQQMVELARNRYEVGKGFQQDVLLAQVELSELFNREANLNGKLDAEKANLARLIGKDDFFGFQIPLLREIEIPLVPSKTSLFKKAEKNRPLLLEKKAKILAAKLRLALSQRGYLPDFTLGTAYGFRQDSPNGMKRPNFASFMVAVNLPIWARSKQSNQIAQRALELSEQRKLYQAAVAEVRRDISRAFSLYESNSRQAHLYNKTVIPQAKQTLAAMLSGYRVNRVDFLNVIRARLALIKYEWNYWRAATSARKARALLLAASGIYPLPPGMKDEREAGN